MRHALAVGVVAGLLGCSTPMAELRAKLDRRASEELECPPADLRYEELARFIATTKLKITGCGRARAYQLQEGVWHKTNDDRSELVVTPPKP